MITGFNTNVRRRGRTFHVQTEDSGRATPRIISHLYCGGTILATERQEYARYLEEEDLDIRVRALMEGQHQALLARLRKGEYDALIDERLAGDASQSSDAAAPAAAADEASGSVSDTTPSLGDATPAPALPPAAPAARAFGAQVVSEKPLDEVILEYLIDKARKRPAAGAAAGPRASRSKG